MILICYNSNVKVTTPFDVESELITSHFTYFDSTGRVMVVLEKSNVVQEHELPIQVRLYAYALCISQSYLTLFTL